MSATTNPSTSTKKGFKPAALLVAMIIGVIIGLSIKAFTPPPMALVAQSGTGTVLSAPEACPTGDKIYQLAINGEEGKEVKDTKLVPGTERVVAKARFNDWGYAKEVTIEASANEGKPRPVLSAVYTWTPPQTVAPGQPLEHHVVRYAVPYMAYRVVLQDTKVAPGKDTTVFACVTTEPR